MRVSAGVQQAGHGGRVLRLPGGQGAQRQVAPPRVVAAPMPRAAEAERLYTGGVRNANTLRSEEIELAEVAQKEIAKYFGYEFDLYDYFFEYHLDLHYTVLPDMGMGMGGGFR